MNQNNSISLNKKIFLRLLEMFNKKRIISIGVIYLFLTLSIASVSANSITNKTRICELELNTLDKLFDEIELAANHASTYQEFLEIVRNLDQKLKLEKFPILKYILNKILTWVTSFGGLNLGKNIDDFLGKLRIGQFRDMLKNNFIFSYGTYKRFNPRKDDEVKLFKQGFEFWRYSGKSMLLKSRTLIITRHPFGIKQRVVGSQMGYMMGFRGFYIDRESKLTGNCYKIFIGGANRIKTFDTTPFS